MRLTPDQAQLVADHYGCAHEAARRARRGPMGAMLDYDTMLSAASLGLCDVARSFDPAQGKFSTLAYRRCWGAIIDEARRLDGQATLRSRGDRERGIESRVAISLDRIVDGDQLGELSTYHEIIADPAPQVFAQVANEEAVTQLEHLIDVLLRPSEATTLRLYYQQDWNLREIGELLGVCESRVSQLKTRALARLRDHYNSNPLVEA